MPGLPLHALIERFQKHCNSYSVLSPNDGMLKAISNATVSVSESPVKTSRAL